MDSGAGRGRVHAGIGACCMDLHFILKYIAQVGLNNMKANDYANVAIQLLTRIAPLRDFFLQPENYASCRSLVVQRFGELVRKLWNPRNFKGQVSPHEFMQAVMAASKKRFIIDRQSDPVDFLTWLVNELHLQLTNGKRKARSIITECLQGELYVTTEAGTGKAAEVRVVLRAVRSLYNLFTEHRGHCRAGAIPDAGHGPATRAAVQRRPGEEHHPAGSNL